MTLSRLRWLLTGCLCLRQAVSRSLSARSWERISSSTSSTQRRPRTRWSSFRGTDMSEFSVCSWQDWWSIMLVHRNPEHVDLDLALQSPGIYCRTSASPVLILIGIILASVRVSLLHVGSKGLGLAAILHEIFCCAVWTSHRHVKVSPKAGCINTHKDISTSFTQECELFMFNWRAFLWPLIQAFWPDKPI